MSIVNVLDLNCGTHDINKLYVVDSSFLPSIGVMNPTLTKVADAILSTRTSQTKIKYQF
ncbi:MAG: GMC oxidoreductase [Cyanobacteria bacterium P01_A01_bin.68]